MTESCICATLPDLAHIPMGDHAERDVRFLETVEEVRGAGGDLWWLYLGKCSLCGENWLVAQEERIFDEHLLQRITPPAAAAIAAGGAWPQTFQTYEAVLRIGRALSTPCHFLDPMSASLVWTVRDLRRERPDIPDAEIGALLGLRDRHVAKLARAAAWEEGAGGGWWRRLAGLLSGRPRRL